MTDNKLITKDDRQRKLYLLRTESRPDQRMKQLPLDPVAALQRRQREIIQRLIEEHDGRFEHASATGYWGLFTSPESCLACGIKLNSILRDEFVLDSGMQFDTHVALHAIENTITELARNIRPHGRAFRICQAGNPHQLLASKDLLDDIHELPEGVLATGLGSHRLRDLNIPLSLYQIDFGVDTPAQYPALTTLDCAPNNLRNQPSEMYGREQELGQIIGLLTGGRQLITILAPGGYGKSRLAIQVCADLLDRFRDGVHVIRLVTITDPEEIPQVTADAIGLQLASGAPAATQIQYFLQNRNILLYFDNFEHVIAKAGFVADLVTAVPGLKILVSSREPLEVEHEVQFKLQALSPGRQLETAEVPVHQEQQEVTDSILLFANRARAVNTKFEIQPATLPLVHHICREVDNIPLAIALAGSWLDRFTLVELHDRLKEQIAIYVTGAAQADRHRSLNACCDWSWQLLDDRQQELLMVIAGFSGTFTLESIQTVLEAVWIEDQAGIDEEALWEEVQTLIKKNWIANVMVDARLRYVIADAALGEFLRSKLRSSSSLRQIELSHHGYFCTLFEIHGRKLDTQAEDEMLQFFTLERENIFHAITVGLTTGNAGDLLPFARYLVHCLVIFGGYEKGYEAYRQMDQVAQDLRDPVLEIQAKVGSSILLNRMGYQQQALEVISQANVSATTGNDPELTGLTLHFKGNIHLVMGEMEAARQCYVQSLAIRRETGNQAGAASTLSNLGLVATQTDRLDEAELYYQESLQIRRAIGDINGCRFPIHNLAINRHLRGDHEGALELFKQCSEIDHRMRNYWGEVNSFHAVGMALFDTGRVEEALPYFNRGLELCNKYGYQKPIVQVANGLAACLICLDRLTEAAEALDRSNQVRRDLNLPRYSRLDAVIDALIRLHRHQYAEARQLLADLLTELLPLHDLVGNLAAPLCTVLLLLGQGNRAEGIELFQRIGTTIDLNSLSSVLECKILTMCRQEIGDDLPPALTAPDPTMDADQRVTHLLERALQLLEDQQPDAPG